MSALPALLGSGASFTVEGRTYHYAPLTLGDEADMEQELRAMLGDRLSVVESVHRATAELPAEERKPLLEQAVREHLRLMRMNALELAQEFQLPEIDALILKFHLRKHHPAVTLEEAQTLLSGPGMQAIARMLDHQRRVILSGEGRGPTSAGASAWHRIRTPIRSAGQLASRLWSTWRGSFSGRRRRSGTSPLPL